jgi:hypothetical protein
MSDASAYEDAAVELGTAIAIGAVPIVGQLIDLYDTLESAYALYRAQTDDEKDDAKFDMILAIVGWVPGPGDGVKKSLRIVNKDPERYAPVLFDLLRRVLRLAGVETSPEALLAGIFDAGYLKGQMASIKQGVRSYQAYQALPEAGQQAVMTVLDATEATMPAMVGIVEKRLLKWKQVQRNSSSTEPARGRAERKKPEGRDANVAGKGKDGAIHGHAGETINATMAEKALLELTNETIGISGEHIADYICAYNFGWGTDWKQHDDGAQGAWTEGAPSKDKVGKLSRGGSPKSGGTLYRLDDGPNGTGIDAVWRAGGNNGGKPYAIVEAKATKDEDAPKFARRTGNTRKPSIKRLLKDNAPDLNPTAEELLEPRDEPDNTAADGQTGKSGGGKGGGRPGGKPSGTIGGASTTKGQPAKGQSAKRILVQMSHDWIRENIERAVPKFIADEIKDLGKAVYARHLFFAPYWHLSGSPKTHMDARKDRRPSKDHEKHDAYHYDEADVKAAVNRRKAKLRSKHGSLPGLKEEA